MEIDTFEDWCMWKKTDAREETELYVYFRFIWTIDFRMKMLHDPINSTIHESLPKKTALGISSLD